jgi:hypothetical protein
VSLSQPLSKWASTPNESFVFDLVFLVRWNSSRKAAITIDFRKTLDIAILK